MIVAVSTACFTFTAGLTDTESILTETESTNGRAIGSVAHHQKLRAWGWTTTAAQLVEGKRRLPISQAEVDPGKVTEVLPTIVRTGSEEAS